MPLATSRDIFHDARVVRPNRRTRNNILNQVAKVIRMSSKPPISKKNKLTRLDWAKKYMKCNFDDVFFTDECRASLDWPDAFGRGWLIDHGIRPRRFIRQQGVGEVMFWDGIISSTLVGPYFVKEAVKTNLKDYVDFLRANFMQWFNNKSKTFKNKMIFMHDNAPSHAARVISQFSNG